MGIRARLQPLALLVIRLVLGVIMIAHGWPKVMNIGGVIAMLSKMGIPGWMAYLVAAAEFGGGILIIAGLVTEFAAAAFIIDMAVAISKVHFSKGLTGQGGYERNLALVALAFALIFFGAGPLSLDRLLSGKKGARARRT